MNTQRLRMSRCCILSSSSGSGVCIQRTTGYGWSGIYTSIHFLGKKERGRKYIVFRNKRFFFFEGTREKPGYDSSYP